MRGLDQEGNEIALVHERTEISECAIGYGVQDRPGTYNLKNVLHMSTRWLIIFWVWTATTQRYEGGKIDGKAQKRARLHGPFGGLSLLSFDSWANVHSLSPRDSKLVLLSFHPHCPMYSSFKD